MNEGESVIKRGQVESVDDSAGALRIKVRLEDDGNRQLSDIPYAFPLLPKAFQSIPKPGEGAFVITTMTGNKDSQRYYLGPIISQPQFNEECLHAYGRGQSTSVLEGGVIYPLEKLSNFSETDGSFPNVEDVAVVGRGGQDVIMRNNKDKLSDEIDIRCGIRQKQEMERPEYSYTANKAGGLGITVNNKMNDGYNLNLVGKVIFNNVDPAYIQLKYKRNITRTKDQRANSIINLVADKINIISNQDDNSFELTDAKELIPEDKLDETMSKLHQLPHGDTLVKLLNLIINAISTHVHPYAGMIATRAGFVQEMQDYETEKILSKHVRIS